uniref:Uncharacterized protein n=1 Tax=Anguilla anguilla TaxID=7936 RepID=A0A0E9UWW9_ANGAN
MMPGQIYVRMKLLTHGHSWSEKSKRCLMYSGTAG